MVFTTAAKATAARGSECRSRSSSARGRPTRERVYWAQFVASKRAPANIELEEKFSEPIAMTKLVALRRVARPNEISQGP